ncbi:hypothetical protein [Pseudarthrobacter sp. B4EP4b]|uniref:hypothetical protein n=1 Tax=Pseudarthrobacter sp. B4EP4b TaxID=2590664 RepID=UPI001154EBF5|nr:hypothetical protein [Pseudarthrobacter sp. B4EP4b]
MGKTAKPFSYVVEYRRIGRLVTGELNPDLIVILPSTQRQVARTDGYLDPILARKNNHLRVKRGASGDKANVV